jgi:hypothetical protein
VGAVIPRRPAWLVLLGALALCALAQFLVLPARPDEALLRAGWLRGELPGWDPVPGLGRPLLGASHAGPWYPPNALALLVPLRMADALRLVAALWLAGIGTWLWHRARFGERAASLDAFAAQFAGLLLAVLAGPNALDSLLWLPWMLWAIERRRGALVCGASALAILGGVPGWSLAALGVGVLTALLHARRTLGWLALGIGVAAVAWIPLLESRAWTEHAGSRSPPELAGDPEARIFQRREAPDRLDAEVESARGGRLVFHEAWHPGWKAVVNGQDAELECEGGLYRAVAVPPGRSIVRTKFEPFALRLGAWTSFGALVFALVLARARKLA